MVSKKIEEALNQQLNAELYSSYLYLSMAAQFEADNLSGMAHWMAAQAKEEWEHGMKFYSFLHDRGGRVVLKQIDTPPVEWSRPLAAFEEAYKHEQLVTSKINALMDLAIKESDYATKEFLGWFVSEQVEEEANVSKIVERLKLLGDSKNGLFMMDHELAKRAAD
ncbi:MAG: ferritin [Phycisphaerae bacterium]|nr:ferritin [Phycisphaerae bacterium]